MTRSSEALQMSNITTKQSLTASIVLFATFLCFTRSNFSHLTVAHTLERQLQPKAQPQAQARTQARAQAQAQARAQARAHLKPKPAPQSTNQPATRTPASARARASTSTGTSTGASEYCRNESDAEWISKLFVNTAGKGDGKTVYRQDRSNCPDDAWMARLAATPGLLANNSNDREGLFINIGFNKGYNFAIWMNLFAPWTNVTPALWYKTLIKSHLVDNLRFNCGVCNDCTVAFENINLKFNHSMLVANNKSKGSVVLLGLDLNRANLNLVNTIFDTVTGKKGGNDEDLGTVSLYLVHGAGSDTHRAFVFDAEGPPGDERYKVQGRNVSSRADNTTSKIESQEQIAEYNALHPKEPLMLVHEIPLDMLVYDIAAAHSHKHPRLQQLLLHHPHHQSIHHIKDPLATATIMAAGAHGHGHGHGHGNHHDHRHTHHSSTSKHNNTTTITNTTDTHTVAGLVDMVIVDTEGYDGVVLRGAKWLISHQVIRCLVFEYHEIGPWKAMKLADSVADLHRHGYDCFFLGSRGRLWPVSSSCWSPRYEFHEWSNVMCMYRLDVWRQAIEPLVVRPRDEKTIALNAVKHFQSKGDFYVNRPVRSELVGRGPSKTTYFVHDDFTKSEFASDKAFLSRNLTWNKVLLVDDFWLSYLPKRKDDYMLD